MTFASDFGAALEEPSAGRFGRGYLGYWETRNLRMASNIRDMFAVQPGVRGLVSNDEPATEQAADAVAKAATGHEIPGAAKPLAGQSVHYALGIGLGIAYGIAAEFRPSVTAGYGTAFGLGTATLLDEAAVPAVGLGGAPWNAPLSTTFYG